jgi:multiple sugar transport system permease protein
MAAVQSTTQRLWNRLALLLVLIVLVITMIPLYWIGSTAFKLRVDATTVPPTVIFKPQIVSFIKLFTTRVQLHRAVDQKAYADAPWWEKLVMDGGERFIKDDKGSIESSGYTSRFLNSSSVVAVRAQPAVAMGTITAMAFLVQDARGGSVLYSLH